MFKALRLTAWFLVLILTIPLFAGTSLEDFHQFIRFGNVEHVSRLLDEHPEWLNAKDSKQINSRDNFGMTALLFATSRGHIDIVDYLLQNGADSSAKTDNNRGAVLMAVLSGQIEMFKYFTENGFSLDEKDQAGNSLLHMALSGRNPEMLKYLLEAGVNVNIPNNHGATPLMNSVFRGDPALTEMLLKAGAQPDITDNRGVSALLESIRSGKPALLQLMLQYSGSVEITDSLTGMNVLHIAAVRGQSDAVKTQNHLLIFDYWETENKPDEIFLRSGYITPEEIKDLNVLVFYPMNTRITLSRKYFSGEITF